VIPERVAKAGCVVEYDAPGGCLGAVTISDALIPAYAIVERRLPGLNLPDGTVLDELVLSPVERAAVTVAGVHREAVCQVTVDKEPGDYVQSVYRPSLYRSSGYQQSAYQPQAYRSSKHVDGQTVPSTSVSSVSAPSLSLPSHSVPSASLSSYWMPGTEVEKTTSDDTTSYITSGDVLFDPDSATPRPEAEASLKAIVAEILARPATATILVEGHTDNVDTAQHNLDLSERRAQAVADWLVAHGVEASRITTVGYGLTLPRADNTTEEGRTLNRRVVISVTG